MSNLSSPKFFIFAIAVLAACAAAIATPAAPAQSDTRFANPLSSSGGRCSNQTLSGAYGFTITGDILNAGLPIRGLALQRYDGRGNITQVDHLVTGGYPPSQDWTPGTGTYTVNADCTGVGVINSPSNPVPINIHFVIVDQGDQIMQVVDANAVTAMGIKVN
jgi:hypothetical protein